MLVSLTGTPGTGKSSVSFELNKIGFEIVDINQIVTEQRLVIGVDKKRCSKIVDIDGLDGYVQQHYSEKTCVIIQGHLSHLLNSVDKIIVLRCHPIELQKRLRKKGWDDDKIRENVEAEILDIILCEAIDIHSTHDVFEIDTTTKSVSSVVSSIRELLNSNFERSSKYIVGAIDWSEEIDKVVFSK